MRTGCSSHPKALLMVSRCSRAYFLRRSPHDPLITEQSICPQVRAVYTTFVGGHSPHLGGGYLVWGVGCMGRNSHPNSGALDQGTAGTSAFIGTALMRQQDAQRDIVPTLHRLVAAYIPPASPTAAPRADQPTARASLPWLHAQAALASHRQVHTCDTTRRIPP